MQLVYFALPFWAIFLMIIGIGALLWLLLHVEVGIRYSRTKTIIAAIIAVTCISISIHFILTIVGTGAF